MRIKALPVLFFDVGSTLVHPDPSVLATLVGLPDATRDSRRIDLAFSYALDADFRALPDGDRSTRRGREFLRLLDPSLPDSATRARELWETIERAGGHGSSLYTLVDPDAHRVLRVLQEKGYDLVAASNSNGTLRAELSEHGLLRYFAATIDSHDIGVEKPSEDFFTLSLASISQIGGRVNWYIGNDLVRDVAASLLAGFDHAILYDRNRAYPGLRTKWRIERLDQLLSAVEACNE